VININGCFAGKYDFVKFLKRNGMSKNLTALSGRKGLENNLFERIGSLAEWDGAPAKEDLKNLAEEFLMGPASVFGAASFYDFTKPENKGKKVYVCNGTACLMSGAQPKLKSRLLGYFREEEIGEMTCLGRCHENSAFHFKGHNYSSQTAEAIHQIIKEEIYGGFDHYYVGAHGRTVLTAEFPEQKGLIAALSAILKKGPEILLQEVKTSGLRGRGGAGFPIGLKIEACGKAAGTPKYVVCNADEGDPGSYSDRFLMEKRPLAVLIGMLLAGYMAGANFGILYIRAEYPESLASVVEAICEMQSAGLAGEDILGSGFDFHFKVIKAQGAYICGEETALLASIEGQRPEVRIRPPYPVEEGLFGKPTLVNNVETLANLFFIAQNGGKAFAAIGSDRSTGTKLISLDSAFRRPGVYEVEMGTPLSTVVEGLGQGFQKPVKALHIGGPLGGLVPVRKIPDLTVDFESFSREGFLLGHASIVSVPHGFPIISYLEHLFEFTAHESCGKCFPCRLGSVRGKELLEKAREGELRIDPALFDDLLDTLEKGSLCGLGGGIPLPVRNALTHFADELTPYFL
jgi:NADH-quinone oxidoreductase subunit F